MPLEDCIVQLVRSFRYDARGGIGRLATCINQGKADEAVALLGSGSSEVRFHELEGSRRDYSERLAALLTPEVRRAYGAYLATPDPAAKLSELQRFRVLVAHRLGRFGQESLNQIVETSLESLGLTPQGSHYHGQPVIIAQNDYQLGIYNGDIGVVLLDEAGHFQTWIATARGLSVIPASRLPQFATAFAMTVHKSQGSEFDEVFLVLPDAESPLLTRELLYTAITRAKNTVHLVGSTRALRAAIARRVERTSGLRSLLWPEPRLARTSRR